jgi:hypothetical protein
MQMGNEGLTGYQVIRLASQGRKSEGGKEGELPKIKTNYAQLASYQECGLLPESPGGRWPDKTPEYLAKAHQLGATTRSLDRRVILRYLQDDDAVVPAAKLQNALVSLAPRIGSPVKKMGIVEQALTFFYRKGLDPNSSGTKRSLKWTRPKVEEWPHLLGQIDLDLFSSFAAQVASLETVVLGITNPQSPPEYTAVGKTVLTKAPQAAQIARVQRDERFLLLLVWFVANPGRNWPTLANLDKRGP